MTVRKRKPKTCAALRGEPEQPLQPFDRVRIPPRHQNGARINREQKRRGLRHKMPVTIRSRRPENAVAGRSQAKYPMTSRS